MWKFDRLKSTLEDYTGVRYIHDDYDYYTDDDEIYNEYPKQKYQVKSKTRKRYVAQPVQIPKYYNLQATKPFIKKVSRDQQFIISCLKVLNCQKKEKMLPPNSGEAHLTIELPQNAKEYINISGMFHSSKGERKITKIEKVVNPFLLLHYELCKWMYQKQYGTVEKQLFHCTKKMNLPSICEFNFNWRLFGTARGHKYGQGVCFAPKSAYANFFGNKNSVDKAMILAKVIVVHKCVGHNDMIVPPKGYDTSVRENSQVFVKYDDNTFYPSYIIRYKDITQLKKFSYRYN